jgi:hypothetical protein
MRGFRLTAVFAGSLLIASAQVIGDVREAIAMHDFARADKYIQNYRAKNGVTPEWLEALSWLGRGALEDKKYDQAERYADETRRWRWQSWRSETGRRTTPAHRAGRFDGSTRAGAGGARRTRRSAGFLRLSWLRSAPLPSPRAFRKILTC